VGGECQGATAERGHASFHAFALHLYGYAVTVQVPTIEQSPARRRCSSPMHCHHDFHCRCRCRCRCRCLTVGKVTAQPVIRCGTGPVIMLVIVKSHSHHDVDYHCHSRSSYILGAVVGRHDWCRLYIIHARCIDLVIGVSCQQSGMRELTRRKNSAKSATCKPLEWFKNCKEPQTYPRSEYFTIRANVFCSGYITDMACIGVTTQCMRFARIWASTSDFRLKQSVPALTCTSTLQMSMSNCSSKM
jgi:hypothetical protein